ncbi:MAG: tripartite tricarboxylate transporter substrate binding protein [Betaproteobacteria bacterium]|nr:tripartite tricarboxylate transporter substrate binding protein [Betaproteobacteria bacterium]
MIVPYPPGGGSDLVARLIGKELAEKWGKSVIIDNRPGGDGAIGAGIASTTPADGHTLLQIILTHAVLPSMKDSLPYDLLRDFAPITRTMDTPNLVVVHPSLPVNSIKELVALAKQQPGKVNYAISGIGGPSHLSGEFFNQLAGTKMTYIPYKGAGPAMIDLLGGHVKLAFPTVPSGIPHVRSGKLRALAITSATRLPLLPALPTVAEAGVKGYEFSAWFGLVTRAGTPRRVVEQLNADITSVLHAENIRTVLINEGAQVLSDTPREFTAFLDAELKRWGRLVKEAGLKGKE